MRSHLTLLAFLSLGCHEPGSDKWTTDVRSVRVDPAEATLSTRPGSPAVAEFRALATFSSGVEKPIDLVAWSSSNASAGSVAADGSFSSSDTNGGVTEITANHLGITGSARVTVVYTDDIVQGGLDPAVVDAFLAAAPAEGDLPALSYPRDGMVVPRNLEGLGFLWSLPAGHDVSRIRFQTELTDISVYSEEAWWLSTSDLWTVITATNREGHVKVHVESGIWDGATLRDVYAGPEVALTINRFDANGSVLYWSTYGGGVVRIPFGTLEGELYWGMEESGGRCTGCHVLSEPLQRMVLTNEGVGGTFTIVDISEPDRPTLFLDADDPRRLTWKTVSPDGLLLLGTTTGANPQPPWNPQPVLYSLVDGQKIKSFNLGAPVGQPDWSPDGTQIVMVRMTGTVNSEFQFTGGEIILVPWDEERQELGEASVLVPADTTRAWNHFYPTFSPDGAWVVYCRSTGDSYSDLDAELWMVSVDGLTKLRLDTVNGPPGTMSSTPRWGPLPDDDVLWLAFSSVRDYPLDPSSMPQIWVTAIEPALAAEGLDPSHEPFWLPGQETFSNNHLPVWWSR
jgi:hypothetical protein